MPARSLPRCRKRDRIMPTTAIAVVSSNTMFLAPMFLEQIPPTKSSLQLVAIPQTQPATFAHTNTLKTKFETLADEWRRNTAFSSSITEIVLDPNYQQIIGMGVAAVPLILNELRNAPEHWFWALAAITGANPAQNEPDGDIQAAADAWIRWGVRRGIIR